MRRRSGQLELDQEQIALRVVLGRRERETGARDHDLLAILVHERHRIPDAELHQHAVELALDALQPRGESGVHAVRVRRAPLADLLGEALALRVLQTPRTERDVGDHAKERAALGPTALAIGAALLLLAVVARTPEEHL